MRPCCIIAVAVAAAAVAPATRSAEAQVPAATVTPRAELVITRSTRLAPGVYDLPASGLDSAVIILRGNDIDLDLAGVQLRGAPPDSAPDRAAGVAILVDGGTNVTIRHGTIRGYKVAIRARGTRNLRLVDADLSYNWKPRLFSLVEHESLADWLSYHQNEKDEWLRYGAAIYLTDVRGGEIRGITARQGMNALLMTRTDSVLVAGNDFSFNSGLGIGMYRSSHNRLLHNRVEYDVRGYSEGFYRRGQDSAGLLMYQQSDSNVVAFNSVTHGGDGLFVWAGQHTMDTGEGGVNDNVFFGNDFSWAPTNAMEATFSRNVFVNNRASGSDYGLWGGYSFESLVLANRLEGNRIGIAIEHGQDNRILANRFDRDSTAVWLWANPLEPGDWGYPKHRDTRSRDYIIRDNVITGARSGLRISETRNVDARSNIIRADSAIVSRGDTAAVAVDTAFAPDSALTDSLIRLYAVAPLEGAERVVPGPYENWPRSTIVVDEWGPYDWRSPRLWPAAGSLETPLRLRVLGPDGAWRLVRIRGARISTVRGSVGDTVTITPFDQLVEDWSVTLAYMGQETRSPNGIVRAAGTPYQFSYSRFDPRMRWTVKVYAWSDSTHPVNEPSAFAALLRGKRGAPVALHTPSRLDYVWYRPTIAGWPQDRAGVVAETDVNLPQGQYLLRSISDDGIRVFVDGRLAIDDWSVHESKAAEAPIAPGRHHLRLEYFQSDGWAELRLEVVKNR